MVEFLKCSIGIVHKSHAMSIASYIKDTVDGEPEDEDKAVNAEEKIPRKRRLTFCVEGNISVGKTTFLQKIANETLELRDLVEVVPEPVGKWQDIGPDHFNILNAFYEEPHRYAYTFQNYVFVTRLMQERESAKGLKPLRLMERSVFSDRMVSCSGEHMPLEPGLVPVLRTGWFGLSMPAYMHQRFVSRTFVFVLTQYSFLCWRKGLSSFLTPAPTSPPLVPPPRSCSLSVGRCLFVLCMKQSG